MNPDLSESPAPRAATARPAPRPSVRFGRLAACLGILAPLFASAPAGAQDGERARLTWGLYEGAPYTILDGPSRDHGIADEIRHLLDRRLKGGPGETITAPFPRILASLKDGAPLCIVSGIKTAERETYAVFSRPAVIFYPIRIVVRETQRARFEALGPLSLRTLLKDHPEFRTSNLRNRTFGPEIDAIFREAPAVGSHSSFTEAYTMLLNDRIDYLVDYANVATYNAMALGAPGAFVGLPMMEESQPIFSRIMCGDTPFGRDTIAEIDAILETERPTPVYRRWIEFWSAPEDVARIREIYDSVFLVSE